MDAEEVERQLGAFAGVRPRNSEARDADGHRSEEASSRDRHVLFICGRNLRRSPTAEQVFSSWPGVEVSLAGISNDADNPVTPEHLEWADLIFVMERTHQTKLSTRFRRYLRDKRVICLGIPDKYEFMDPALVQRVRERVSGHLPPPQAVGEPAAGGE